MEPSTDIMSTRLKQQLRSFCYRPHTRNASLLNDSTSEVIQHPPRSLNLATCDYQFFPDLEKHLRGTHFEWDEDAKEAAES
jgi:hypothetical protein